MKKILRNFLPQENSERIFRALKTKSFLGFKNHGSKTHGMFMPFYKWFLIMSEINDFRALSGIYIPEAVRIPRVILCAQPLVKNEWNYEVSKIRRIC